MIDVAGGDDIPRKKGPGLLRCDLLVVNKIDLAPYVGVELAPMLAEARRVRANRPVIATNARSGVGIKEVADAIPCRSPCSEPDAGRAAEVLLAAELAGGRTILRRQHVGYPFHITRPFQLDRMRPDLATLYLQSTVRWPSTKPRTGWRWT